MISSRPTASFKFKMRLSFHIRPGLHNQGWHCVNSKPCSYHHTCCNGIMELQLHSDQGSQYISQAYRTNGTSGGCAVIQLRAYSFEKRPQSVRNPEADLHDQCQRLTVLSTRNGQGIVVQRYLPDSEHMLADNLRAPQKGFDSQKYFLCIHRRCHIIVS